MRLLEHLRWPERLVVCFHAIDDTWPHDLSVPSAVFERFVAGLAAGGYAGRTFRAALAARPGERVVAITFDDAFSSVASVAAPILETTGWPGTVFVSTDPMFKGTPMTPSISPETYALHPIATATLTPRELQVLAEAGWEVGSHGRTHRPLSRLPDDELAEELGRSRADLEEVVGSCLSISYPWGEVDGRVVAAARAAGYVAGAGLRGRFSWGDPLRVPRGVIYGTDRPWRLALKTSRPIWALRSTALWDLTDAARGHIGPHDQHTPLLQRGLAALSSLVNRL